MMRILLLNLAWPLNHSACSAIKLKGFFSAKAILRRRYRSARPISNGRKYNPLSFYLSVSAPCVNEMPHVVGHSFKST